MFAGLKQKLVLANQPKAVSYCFCRLEQVIEMGLSKTCRDDAGKVLQVEMPRQPLIKDAGTLATLDNTGSLLNYRQTPAETPGQWRRCTKADRRPSSSEQLSRHVSGLV